MPMPMPFRRNPQAEAINRTMAAQGGGIGNKPPIPGQTPQGGAPGGLPKQAGGQSPVEVAIKILELIVQRLSQMNPAAAQKLGAALGQLKSVIEEVKKELAAGKPASQPVGATPPAAVPGPNQPGGGPMPSRPMPQ